MPHEQHAPAAEPARLKSAEPDSKVIIKLVNSILIDAQRRGASDIHFEPGTGTGP